MSYVLDTFWFYPPYSNKRNIGIVKVRDGYEIKSYIGLADGFDEQEDIKMILERGCRFYPEVFGGNW